MAGSRRRMGSPGPSARSRARMVLAAGAWALAACSVEQRSTGPTIAASPPVGAGDPRASHYETNAWEVSEGGRQFRWQGCGGCHEGAKGPADLTDKAWRYGGSTAAIYASIAQGRPGGMPAYGAKVDPQGIWRMAGYLHGLADLPAPRRKRQDADQAGEPEGARWRGPLS